MAISIHTEIPHNNNNNEEEISLLISAPPNSPTALSNHGSEVPPSPLMLSDSILGRPGIQDHLTRTLSTISLNQLKLEADQFREKTKAKMTPSGRPFTVAISGCSSSGKTNLAVILKEIFSFAGGDESFSGATSGIEERDCFQKRNYLIHQDSYFVAKRSCDTVTFTSLPEDSDFCRKSLESMTTSEYTIVPSSATDDTVGGKDVYQISGPDTDSVTAINFYKLLRNVRKVKSGVSILDLSFDVSCIKERYGTLINWMRDRVSAWVKDQSIKNAELRFGGNVIKSPIANSDSNGKASIRAPFCFVEGFLLFTNPTRVLEMSSEERAEKANIYNNLMEVIMEEKWTDRDFENLEDCHKYDCLISKKELMPLFEMKLFLPTSKIAASARRLGRIEYTDFPNGQRKPGQMWKTQGYFENVAWKNYVEDHSWLIDDEGALLKGIDLANDVDGIKIRAEMDADVEKTVQWAVAAILSELGNIEESAREACRWFRKHLGEFE